MGFTLVFLIYLTLLPFFNLKLQPSVFLQITHLQRGILHLDKSLLMVHQQIKHIFQETHQINWLLE